MAKYTFNKLAEEILKNSPQPLSVNDIWDYAVKNGQAASLGSGGKTPEATLGARLYTDVKNNDSIFIQFGKRPALFGLKNKNYDTFINNEEKLLKETYNNNENEIVENFNERDLHPLLVAFLQSNPHFMCNAKTIYHEKSIKRQKGFNEWLHPDIVGVQLPFDEYNSTTLHFMEYFPCNKYKMFSFEIKVELNFKNIREFYFQALSNSNWANEGYLVTLNLEKDPDFINEINRLNNAFGIGLIKLDPENIEQSEIILYAKSKDIMDWDTINRLVEDSPDFSDLVEDI